MYYNLILGFVPAFYLFYVALVQFKLIPFSLFVSDYGVSFCIFLSFTYFLYRSTFLFRYKKTNDSIAIIALLVLILPIIINGPFFQPPSDPVFHAELLWDSIDENNFNLPNREFISKAIFKSFYSLSEPIKFKNRLALLHVFHAISCYLMAISVYFSSRVYGLVPKWSLFSSLTMFLFFGTNRFSFISYYSLAPSSLNFSFIWLFNSIIFNQVYNTKICSLDRLERNSIVFLSIFFLMPILAYNHFQEILFLGYMISINIVFLLYKLIKIYKKPTYFFYAGFLLLYFFPFSILHRYEIDIPYIKKWHEFDYFFQDLYSYYGTPWIFFRPTAPRIWDTLGVMGIIPIVSILFLSYGKSKWNNNHFKFLIPGIMPFWIYLIPTNMVLWTGVMPYSGEVFWRVTYISQYWISVSYLLYIIEIQLYSCYKKTNWKVRLKNEPKTV